MSRSPRVLFWDSLPAHSPLVLQLIPAAWRRRPHLADSYAYDGHRKKTWNVGAMRYGDQWVPGDVIGSCIDLEAGTIEFYRNGKSLGGKRWRRGVAPFSLGLLWFGFPLYSHVGCGLWAVTDALAVAWPTPRHSGVSKRSGGPRMCLFPWPQVSCQPCR